MTEQEEKKAAETAEAEKVKTEEKEKADAEFETSLEGLSEDEQEEKRVEKKAEEDEVLSNKDHEVELENQLKTEQEARIKAEKALADADFKRRDAKRKAEEEAGGGSESTPITKEEMEDMLSKQSQANQKEIRSARVEEIAGHLGTSDTEKKLIIEIHKNRSFPAHLTLEEQVAESYAIANSKRLVGERNEALRALRGKEGVVTDTSGTHVDAQLGTEPKLSPGDTQALKEGKFVFNNTSRRWEKKLPRGQILVRDPKTKRTFLVK